MRAFLFCLVSARCFPGLCPNRPRGIGVENLRAGEKPRLGFVCPAKKPQNLVGKGRANSALFSVTRFSPLLWENTTGSAALGLCKKKRPYAANPVPARRFAMALRGVWAKIWNSSSRTFQIYRRYKNAKSRGQRACKQYAIFICVFWRCPAQRGLCHGVPV